MNLAYVNQQGNSHAECRLLSELCQKQILTLQVFLVWGSTRAWKTCLAPKILYLSVWQSNSQSVNQLITQLINQPIHQSSSLTPWGKVHLILSLIQETIIFVFILVNLLFLCDNNSGISSNYNNINNNNNNLPNFWLISCRLDRYSIDSVTDTSIQIVTIRIKTYPSVRNQTYKQCRLCRRSQS